RAPSRDELAVAGHAGPWIAAVWVKQKGDGVSGTIQLYDPNLRRPRAKIRVTDAAARTCGPGCATFRTSSGRARLRIFAVSRHRTFAGEVPFQWSTSGNAEAERLARAAPATMRALRSARLLTPTGGRRERLVEVALADPGGPDASRPPFWFRLTIDRATKRVVRMRMTAPGHFMVQRYFAFNRASGIRRPR